MTPDELRKLADEATGPIEVEYVEEFQWSEPFLTATKQRALARERLYGLAPDLARLCAELGEALAACLQYGTDEDDRQWVAIDPRGTKPAQAALAKLSELNNGAEHPPGAERA